MSTTAKSAPGRRRPKSARSHSHILFNKFPVVGVNNNGTSATSFTRNKVSIQVSLVFKRPPQVSTVFLDCSDLNPAAPPEMVCSVDDLLLLRVNVGRGFNETYPNDYDYFVYRAGSVRPSLELLANPHPLSPFGHYGLLPCSDGYYVAALKADNETLLYGQYHLHVFDSKTSSWSSSMVSVEKPWPVKVPGGPPLCHFTTTVITIGGESGTVAWVDLWSGLLLCNLLSPVRSIRALPLPLPLEDGFDPELGYPGDIRGISYIRDKGVLKFVHLEITDKVEETKKTSFEVDDWALTTWSGKMMGNSLKDWQREHSVQASKITVDNTEISRVLGGSGFLGKPQDNEAKAEQPGLHNLSIYQPTPCSSGEGVVYLMASQKFMHPKTWMLAVDMKNGGKLLDVAFLGNLNHYFSPMYYPSRISKYVFPKRSMNLATTPVAMAAEESSNEAGAVEYDG